MTAVSFDLYRDTFIFECTGHTGYRQHGSDILCSAVSVLCYTLLDFLKQMKDCGRIAELIYDIRDAAVRIEYTPLSEADHSVNEAVRAVLGGFRLLGENFPDHIIIDF